MTENPVSEMNISPFAALLPGKTKKEKLLLPALAAVYCLFGFIFCSNPLPYTEKALGIPLAGALLCSSGAYAPLAFIGSIIGAVYFGKASVPFFLAYTFIFVLRICIGLRAEKSGEHRLFGESIAARISCGAVLALTECLMLLALNSFDKDTVYSVIGCLTLLPSLTAIFSVFFTRKYTGAVTRTAYEISMLIFFSCAVYCARETVFAFFSLDTLLTVFFTLALAKHGGIIQGTVCGAVLGYIVSPMYMPSFLLLGIVSSLLFPLGVFGSAGISTAAACVVSVIIGGANALLSFIPETLLASAVATPVLRYRFMPTGFPYPLPAQSSIERFRENEKAEVLSLLIKERLLKASALIKSTRDTLSMHSAGENERIPAKDACEGFCKTCSLLPICHESEAEKSHPALNEFYSLLKADPSPSQERIPAYLSHHCIKLKELAEFFKESVALPAEERRTADFFDAEMASEIIKNAALSAERGASFDRKSEEKISKLLYSEGVPFSHIYVFGEPQKTVMICSCPENKFKKSKEKIHSGISRILASSVSEPIYDDEHGGCVTFKTLPRLKAVYAFAASCKSGETVNGDSFLTFSNGEGGYYAMISDGMGSGRTAASASFTACELMKALLSCNVDRKTAFSLIGNAISKVYGESFATVDLFYCDLFSGKGGFAKSYAPASYIIRGGSVYTCASPSLPIGIYSNAEGKETELYLMAGDTVVMVSDGIADGPDDILKITDILGLSAASEVQEIADTLLSKAVALKGKGDDKSVTVLRLLKNE